MSLDKELLKKYLSHIRTMGAYVQDPKPAVVGLSAFQVIGSQDAKSLYPTIMVLSNIGYDSLYGRVYDHAIVGKILNYIEMSFGDKSNFDNAVTGFTNAIKLLAERYASREEVTNKKDFLLVTNTFYPMLFKAIISYKGKLEDIYEPKDDETYFLLKSCLFPLLEAITWLHELNKGHNSTILDYVFYNDTFYSKYQDQNIIVFENINSVKTQLKKYNVNNIDSLFQNYLLNTFGTLFYKHDIKKSIEVDLILNGMDDRAFVKNQSLILKAITENWKKLSEDQQLSMITEFKIDEKIAKDIIEIVGDPDPKTREYQLKDLLNVEFSTHEIKDILKLYHTLKIKVAQKDSESNGIKVTLNSGYGIFAMITWGYANPLIANSITNGGKIYGIKLFQQIASNVLSAVESGSINIDGY